MNLEELEKSLAEIQTSISALSSINLAAPDEYLSRQSNLSELLQQTELKRNQADQELAALAQKSASAEGELNTIRQKQAYAHTRAYTTRMQTHVKKHTKNVNMPKTYTQTYMKRTQSHSLALPLMPRHKVPM